MNITGVRLHPVSSVSPSSPAWRRAIFCSSAN